MKATIKEIGIQTGTDRSVFITWEWDSEKNPTDHYEVKWSYGTGDGVWFEGNTSNVTTKSSVYSAQSNAIKVKVKVRPISKTRKVGNSQTTYFTAEWSTEKVYSFSDNPPVTPEGLTAEIEKYKLTAHLNNLNVNATHIEFQINKNNKKFNVGSAAIKGKAASYSCTVDAGGEYEVRCRSYKGEDYSEWSDFVTPSGGTAPSASGGIKSVKALSSTSVSIDWKNVSNAKTYEIQWTTKKKYFDSSNQVDSLSVDAEIVGHAEITGLESGQEYFFRVRSVNDHGASDWTEIVSIVLGRAPVAPTTWSSTTTAMVGERVALYWVHNTQDGSKMTEALINLTINGESWSEFYYPEEIGEEEPEPIYSFPIDTSQYNEGTKIQWSVKTKGIAGEYSESSIQRTIDVYAPPSLQFGVVDKNGDSLTTIRSFPFYISAIAGPTSQTPTSYHVEVVSRKTYSTVDQVGNEKIVNKGDVIYSRYFDTPTIEDFSISAGDIDLENNASYAVNCTVSMNSGLMANATDLIHVAWKDEEYYPDCEIGIDDKSATASIMPYCVDVSGNLVDDILLSVYRREYDGSFVEIATGLRNARNTFVTDPHPSLDYARYRIVAISESTGAVSYYDAPGEPVGEKAVIVQWGESWSNFDATEESATEEPSWTGSLLRLPYNIDISDSSDPDVELVKYIGREHPVGYYGTQRGEKSVWNMVIPKKDKDTLYALRRLKNWMGNVYIREPSGSGYWASIIVSYSQKHDDLTIPVTFDVVRVEGGK